MSNGYIIIKEKKLIFSEIPKSGCQSIRKLVLDFYGIESSIWEGIKPYFRDNIKDLDDYKLISLVRNPYNRAVSAYYNKFVQDPRLSKVMDCFKYFERDIETGISFREFCEYLLIKSLDDIGNVDKQKLIFLDPHWKPQNLIIGDTERSVLIKIEDHKRYEYFFKETGIKLIKYLSTTEKNKNSDFNTKIKIEEKCTNLNRKDFKEFVNSGKVPEYNMFYDDYCKEAIDKIYTNDFDLLGYSKEII